MDTSRPQPTKKIIVARGSRGVRRRRWWLLPLAGFLVGMVAGVGFTFADQALRRITGSGLGGALWGERPFGGQQQVNILLIGTDNTPTGLGDTLMVARVDVARRRLGVISIPRDTRAQIPGRSTQKINSAHALGGKDLMIRTVSQFLGIPIDYYMRVNSAGLAKVVDAAGGIEIDVEKRMHYTDRSQDLYINLQPGLQQLDGRQAVGYVRFRHDAEGDIGRIGRQQKFVRALAQKIGSRSEILHLRAIFNALFSVDTVKTNLSLSDIRYLAKLVGEVSSDNVPMAMLPGEPRTLHRISYWVVDPEAAKRTIEEVLYAQPSKVEVVDATGSGGQVQGVVTKLQSAGFMVMDIQTAPARSQSRVIQRYGREEKAQKLLRLLPSGAQLVHGMKGDPMHPYDFTIEVGQDLIASSGMSEDSSVMPLR
jgi:polyisoprenyl-teichoic acid--peptidoglycan teichoic acid transferase